MRVEKFSGTGEDFQCLLCYKQFTLRSSYTRHSRQCLEKRLASPRRKACHNCVKSKARCDQKRPQCSRCVSQAYACEYGYDGPLTGTELAPITPSPDSEQELNLESALTREANGFSPQNEPIRHPYSVESHAIYKHSMTFVCRVLRTYPRMMSRSEQLPPFIHPTQVSPENPCRPLANCFSISRMWAAGEERGMGGDFVEPSIRREMDRLFDEYRTYDEKTLIGAFQALILYTIMLLFPVPEQPPSKMFDIQTLVSLQDVGHFIQNNSLILPEELSHIRPTWERWIQACCKRRSLMVLHLFEWTNAILNDMSDFPCSDMGDVPASAAKLLWNAETKEKWESAYDRWLGRWAGKGYFKAGEFPRIGVGLSLPLRAEMWLEEADEFGVMIMSLSTEAVL